jgi:hypothetical protein
VQVELLPGLSVDGLNLKAPELVCARIFEYFLILADVDTGIFLLLITRGEIRIGNVKGNLL